MLLRTLIGVATVTAVHLLATSAGASIVSDWNAAALQEVRLSRSLRNGPPMVARALAITHTCMYDAWAQFSPPAIGSVLRLDPRPPVGSDPDATKAEAISFAAYRCLRNLYPDDGNYNAPPSGSGLAATPGDRLADVLASYGYSLGDASNFDTTTAAGVGNAAAQAIIDARANDGANQYGGSGGCTSGTFCPSPTVVITTFTPPACSGGQLVSAPSALQPIPCVPGGANGAPYADYDTPGYTHYTPSNPLMGFCFPYLAVCPDPDPFIPAGLPWPNVLDPNGWQPLIFSSHARQTFVGAQFGRVTPFALTSGAQFEGVIEPPAFLRTAGWYQKQVNDLIKYSRNLDEGKKLIVEYWADGPDSELPPGHWGLFAQFVSQRDGNTIDQDVRMFFAMHNASFDAGIVAWYTKRKYNGVRPITAIRYTKQGETIQAWGGPGHLTESIAGEKWMPYNPGSNLTPPFPGYYSGHSTFSRSSATILNLFTGSDGFGFSTVIPACDPNFFLIDFSKCFGRVEPGIPSVDTTMAFATFSDAANAAGLSRLHGGIHFPDDNVNGQAIGHLIALEVWAKAQNLFNGIP